MRKTGECVNFELYSILLLFPKSPTQVLRHKFYIILYLLIILLSVVIQSILYSTKIAILALKYVRTALHHYGLDIICHEDESTISIDGLRFASSLPESQGILRRISFRQPHCKNLHACRLILFLLVKFTKYKFRGGLEYKVLPEVQGYTKNIIYR